MPGIIKPLPGAAMLAALVVLAGCDKPGAHAVGRWAVVPAATTLVTGGSIATFTAWRLDTETGDLELCQYGSRPINGTPVESLQCSDVASGPAATVKIDLDGNP